MLVLMGRWSMMATRKLIGSYAAKYIGIIVAVNFEEISSSR